MQPAPRLLVAGDRVLVIECGEGIDAAVNARVHGVARAIRQAAIEGVTDVVPSYRSVAVHFASSAMDLDEVGARLTEIARKAFDAEASTDHVGGRVVEVPVIYGGDDGPDLAEVAAHVGLSVAEVVAVHSAPEYRVFMVGFSPGFPYLGGMDPRLTMPRLAAPRVRVPAGSVGIAGPQTGIYPTASPGGWRLIGRTLLQLFNPYGDPPSLLEPGDRVWFVPVTGTEPGGQTDGTGQPAPGPSYEVRPQAELEVLDGGLLTTIQDAGRHGFQHDGVPVAGAMDVFAFRAANRLVGNPDTHAALEMTALGPTLRFRTAAVIALTGADLRSRLNGAAVPRWQSVRVRAGDTLACAGPPAAGLRAYVAVAGGIDVVPVMGSRSTYLPSGFGGLLGRALRSGDTLPVGPRPPVGDVLRRAPMSARPQDAQACVRVRVLGGPQLDAFSDHGIRTFLSSDFVVTDRADRIGCRLNGPVIEHRTSADIVSDGTAFGSVQIAGDGHPIVLMADRGTTGGYTKIATVVAADLGKLAQAAPGTRVRFDLVGAPTARAAGVAQEAALDRMTADATERDAADDDVFDEVTGYGWAPADAASLRAGVQTDGTGGTRRARTDGRAAVSAGLSGMVVDVMVTAGDAVAERQPLVVIEAMKMQNPLRSPRAGVVARVGVSVGDAVNPSTVVVVFEE